MRRRRRWRRASRGPSRRRMGRAQARRGRRARAPPRRPRRTWRSRLGAARSRWASARELPWGRRQAVDGPALPRACRGARAACLNSMPALPCVAAARVLLHSDSFGRARAAARWRGRRRSGPRRQRPRRPPRRRSTLRPTSRRRWCVQTVCIRGASLWVSQAASLVKFDALPVIVACLRPLAAGSLPSLLLRTDSLKRRVAPGELLKAKTQQTCRGVRGVCRERC